MQTCIGPSEEHVNMAGILTEASILGMIDKALPGKVLNCCSHRAGGGKYMVILQCKKAVHTDEGKQRQAAHAGGMLAVGIGSKENLPEADCHLSGFAGVRIEEVEMWLSTTQR